MTHHAHTHDAPGGTMFPRAHAHTHDARGGTMFPRTHA